MENNKLKKLGLSNVCPSLCYEGTSDLETTIVAQSNYNSSSRIMTFNVKNNFTYLFWLHTLPIEPTEGGEIQNPGLFKVKKNNEEVLYQGRISAASRVHSLEFYSKIEPGETYSFEFNPGLSFEMQDAGSYSIEYIGDLNYLKYDPIAAKVASDEENSTIFFPEISSEQIESGQPGSNLESPISNFTLNNDTSGSTTINNEVLTPVSTQATFVTAPLASSSLAISSISEESIESKYDSTNAFFLSTGGVAWTETSKREVIGARVYSKYYADRGASAAHPGKYFERWFGEGGHRNECTNVYIDGNCVGIGNKRFKCRLTGREGWKNNKAGCNAECGKWERRCKTVSTQPERANRVRGACQNNSSISGSRYINWIRESCPRGYLAYVYSDRPNHVWLCNYCYFYNGAGYISGELIETILHEFFHHAGVTQDHAYGTQECLSLARNSQVKALNNADSYTYFSMRA